MKQSPINIGVGGNERSTEERWKKCCLTAYHANVEIGQPTH